MRLLIVSHTAHSWGEGGVLGWGPTVREVDFLAQAFDSVTHLACLHPAPPPPSALPYRSGKVRFVAVPPAGGSRLREKLRALLSLPVYGRAVASLLPAADVVHVRAPHALAFAALVLLALDRGKPRWVKYGGSWAPGEARTAGFALQRAWLKAGLSSGPVTVNGRWPDQPAHVFSLDNPCLSLAEVRAARPAALRKRLERPLRLVFAGRLEQAKGAQVALEALARLSARGEARLDVLGDGPERGRLERQSEALRSAGRVTFHGWVSPEQVHEFLAQAHFLLHPSAREGWPKALGEAMAHGAVPVAGAVSAIPQVLEESGAGLAYPPGEAAGFAEGIAALAGDAQRWKAMSLAGVAAAPRFTYERYLVALDGVLAACYGSSPLDPAAVRLCRERLACPE